ncbi:hypothetical protein GGR56DRAFT_612732 [Xylariaceae sp. FL0804]|nr:hypothetical protein GGR56DRAFT_612732 [Xylariaceae sp. FL0804]
MSAFDQNAALFVTASAADHKVINRFLLHFRDWEYGSGDVAHLVATRSVSDLATTDPPPGQATSPPVAADRVRAWHGGSVAEVEAFLLDLDPQNAVTAFLILDDTGVRERTVIVAERAYDDDDDDDDDYNETPGSAQGFRRMRVPWDEAYLTWCNLDIANVSFEECCDEEHGDGGDGWWKYQSVGGADLSEENRAKRDAEIRKLEEQGLA